MKFKELLKNFEADALLITDPVNVYYITGVHADSTYITISEKGIKIITNFIYYDDIKNNLKIDAKVVKYDAKDFFSHFEDGEYVFESEYMTYANYEKLSSKLKLKPAKKIIENLRLKKEESEIDKIKKAVDITDRVFSDILNFIKEGMTEKEVKDEISYLHKKYGAETDSFEPIVAYGENSAFPHARAGERVIKKGKMLKIDFGCMYEHYASDMTRTIFIGKADEKFRKIYDIVLSAQLKAIESIKPGVKAADIDKVAREYIESKGYGEKFGHGLGHGVGLQVHEEPYLAPSSKGILEEGNVVTVEPGIYIPGWGGIRIEDDVVVRKDGAEILNKSTKKIIELEI